MRCNQAVALNPAKRINWMGGRNFAPPEIATRGQFGEALRRRRALVLGAGAIGSVLAELLVRGGVHDLVVMDGGTLEAGNLVRHTLTLPEVGLPKAIALGHRLNLMLPHARVVAVPARFPSLDQKVTGQIMDRDLIIDCTGEDDTLHALSEHAPGHSTAYASVSLGRRGSRCYLFLAEGSGFPATEFWSTIAPHLEDDRAATAGLSLPWEGIGCWHPVFPATAVDVWRAAGTAVREIDRACGGEIRWDGLRVIDHECSRTPVAKAGSIDRA